MSLVLYYNTRPALKFSSVKISNFNRSTGLSVTFSDQMAATNILMRI